tara:strand:+ start:395 stop:1108 length:714 start_codon:yes stop_codon:yes gene_type:complete
MIPSRMASSRFPGKPMVKINGKPMIQRVWQQAINCNIGDVVVACSENEVFDLITNLGGKAILTNPNLPSGTDRIYSALTKMPEHKEFDFVINLQGDMPIIKPQQIKKVINPLKHKYSIGTLATNLKKDEVSNKNVTKVSVKWDKNNIGQAKEFFRYKDKVDENTFHHVGIYSYTINSIKDFVKLPTSKNEKLLNLEQYRAMDAGIGIGVTLENNIPPSIDTKEDLNLIETIIRENNE